MTKAELLAALEPFTDEIEIAIGEDGGFSEITGHAYGLSKGGDGWLILDRGGRVELPRVVRPRMETVPAPEASIVKAFERSPRRVEETQAVCDRASHLADVPTPRVPKGHFWRGVPESNRHQCRNCGEHYDKHLHTDEASTCPTANREPEHG
jgi:hypothetical protein